MSDTTPPAGGKRLAVYAINEKDGDRASWWQRIGQAFTNRDGSIAIYLDALPLGTNKLQVREQRDEARPGAPGQNGAQRGAGAEEVRP
ncbi:MAG: hypothetical protein IPO09_04720 [Anaeromyxobacter sp.]|nr:hypothetical protein [Anaeromyxobacter sp.]MBL0275888.1 hypothetical protein [Anaeromyxobacter sp.]